MPKTSKWVRPVQKRHKAVAYGCYLPDDDPNPLDVDRDAEISEQEAERERRREATQLIAGIRASTKGRARVGKWDASD